MNLVQSFFIDRGFDFEQSLKSANDSIEKNESLSEILKQNIFIYSSSPQPRTSFYVLTKELNSDELNDFRTFVWNENKVDLFFVLENSIESELFENFGFNLYYAKSSPKLPLSQIRVGYFSNNEKDIKKLEHINKWQFDSGAFWLNYSSFLYKIKKAKSIDKELITTLKALKNGLYDLIQDEKNVQALIDRTLYIKYLENNHIINSAFYLHYFKNANLNFKQLLENNDVESINKLFGIINEIFNNYLFQTPEIEIKYLQKACELISISLSRNINDDQLRLFDYQFNILPVEFISYIYEIFLEEKSNSDGIYYTPKKLAQLIVDDVIPEGKIGTVLDPACGSGMFLIIAFQRLIENSNFISTNIEEIITFRIKLLSENIFGIEKQPIAHRFTIFSLSLQIFKDLPPEKIKIYIANKLIKEVDILLFRKNSFFDNIIDGNSLSIENKTFEDKKFNYIVGNPPFFEIKELEGFENENKFLKDYETNFSGRTFKAKDIIGDKQISQCFLLKIKDWSDINTRFGFVVNNSNFYGNAKNFQEFFFENYQLEKLYELSKLKKILFENANASVNALIFNNNSVDGNFVKYYPIEMGLFSEKPFELLIINEDKAFEINQNDILINKIKLRDYLIGNDYDLNFILKFENHNKMNELLESQKESYQGLTRKSNKEILDYFKIVPIEFKKLSRQQKTDIQTNYDLEQYSNLTSNNSFSTPFLYNYYHINNFKIEKVDGYINLKSINKDNFQRHRNVSIFKGEKIIFTRVGNNIKAVLVNDCVFSVNIFGVKVKEQKYSKLILALLNSDFINYIINIKDKIRIDDNFPRIDIKSIKNIPIPKDLDEDLVAEISKISNDLSTSKYNFEGKNKEKLNNLIFDLYDLSFLEKQRIRDYFITKATIKKSELANYKEALKDTIEVYFNNTIDIESYDESLFNLIVVKINIGSNNNNPSPKKTTQFILNEIFEQNSNDNFLASQEKIFGKDCIYIIKKNENINWTETKAYEDGQEILKNLN